MGSLTQIFVSFNPCFKSQVGVGIWNMLPTKMGMAPPNMGSCNSVPLAATRTRQRSVHNKQHRMSLSVCVVLRLNTLSPPPASLQVYGITDTRCARAATNVQYHGPPVGPSLIQPPGCCAFTINTTHPRWAIVRTSWL